jgi:SAM-dependent methyltransferase
VPPFSEFSDPQLVKTYDTVNPIAEYETFHLDLAAKLSASSIIDIACVTGLLTCELANRGHRLIGVDPSNALLALWLGAVLAVDKWNGSKGTRWKRRQRRSLHQVTPDNLLVPADADPGRVWGPSVSVLHFRGTSKNGFAQSTYSSQWLVGVTARRCALISGNRWLESGRPAASASAAALSHSVTPPIFMASAIA